MPNTHKIIIVCLPDTHSTEQLKPDALAAATAAGVAGDRIAAVRHFPIRKRRTRRLLQPAHQVAAGGPLHLLRLDAMETIAGQHAWHRFTVWSRVVRGTQPAQPFWRFADRHRQDPTRYPLARARQDYLAQSRIQAMSIYNAAVPMPDQIPTGDLEALQVNGDAYVALARMRAVPAGGVVTLDRTLLAAADDRLSTVHGYLGQAQQCLHALSGRHHLVALAIG
jgi:hypothetical protein